MQQANDQPVESRLIVMLVYPGVMTMDVFGPLEAFASANHVADAPLYRLAVAGARTAAGAPPPGVARAPLYRLAIAGMTTAPVATSIGIVITPTIALDDIVDPIDTLLVSGG